MFIMKKKSQKNLVIINTSHLKIVLIALLFSVLMPRWSPAEVLIWLPKPQSNTQWRLEKRYSTQLAVHDSKGNVIPGSKPEKSIHHLDATFQIEWKKAQKGKIQGQVRIINIHKWIIDDWKASNGAPTQRLQFSISLPLTAPYQFNVRFRESELRTLHLWSGGKTQRTQLLQTSLIEAWQELAYYQRILKTPVVSTPGQSWKTKKKKNLYKDIPVNLSHEFEYLKKVKAKKVKVQLAQIEGAIRQNIPGAPKSLKNHPGLFPGTVTWLHDLKKNRAHWIELKRVTKIPIADNVLPIMKTLSCEAIFRAAEPGVFSRRLAPRGGSLRR